MQGDYVNEDASGIPYMWQCIESSPPVDPESWTSSFAECSLVRFKRAVKTDAVAIEASIQEFEVGPDFYRIPSAVAATIGSPDEYWSKLGKNDKSGGDTNEAVGFEGQALVRKPSNRGHKDEIDVS